MAVNASNLDSSYFSKSRFQLLSTCKSVKIFRMSVPGEVVLVWSVYTYGEH